VDPTIVNNLNIVLKYVLQSNNGFISQTFTEPTLTVTFRNCQNVNNVKDAMLFFGLLQQITCVDELALKNFAISTFNNPITNGGDNGLSLAP